MSAEPVESCVAEFTPTFACWDLLEYLDAHRPVEATVADLAERIGRPIRDVTAATEVLVAAKVLKQTWLGPTTAAYTYDPPPETLERVVTFLARLRNPDVRLEVVTAILKLNEGGRRSAEPRFGVGWPFRR